MSYKGSKLRMGLDFSIATLEARRQWSNAFKMKASNFKPIILYPTKLTTKCAGRIKTFFTHVISEKDTSYVPFLRRSTVSKHNEKLG